MKREDFWKRVWIPISKRIPELDDKEPILIWNPRTDEVTVQEAMIANCGARAILNKDPISHDRYFTKWCKIYVPEK